MWNSCVWDAKNLSSRVLFAFTEPSQGFFFLQLSACRRSTRTSFLAVSARRIAESPHYRRIAALIADGEKNNSQLQGEAMGYVSLPQLCHCAPIAAGRRPYTCFFLSFQLFFVFCFQASLCGPPADPRRLVDHTSDEFPCRFDAETPRTHNDDLFSRDKNESKSISGSDSYLGVNLAHSRVLG